MKRYMSFGMMGYILWMKRKYLKPSREITLIYLAQWSMKLSEILIILVQRSNPSLWTDQSRCHGQENRREKQREQSFNGVKRDWHESEGVGIPYMRID